MFCVFRKAEADSDNDGLSVCHWQHWVGLLLYKNIDYSCFNKIWIQLCSCFQESQGLNAPLELFSNEEKSNHVVGLTPAKETFQETQNVQLLKVYEW